MSSLAAGLITLVSIFAGTLIGMFLGKILPHHHLQKATEDTVKLASGIIATLAALVLGLLVASAKNSFDSTSEQITQAGAKIVLLDNLLTRYGPEAKPVRQDLHDALAAGIARIWSGQKAEPSGSKALEITTGFPKVQNDLFALEPSTDAQRTILSQAQQASNDLLQSKWLVIEQSQGTLPLPLFIILVSWLAILFVSIGLFSPRNGTALAALFLAALAFSEAVFLIVEMNRPLDGMLKISDAPLRKVLEHINP
jgi:hypothetical protein